MCAWKQVEKQTKIPDWLLNGMNFHYIPAVRDAKFFESLQGKLYSTLAKSSSVSRRNFTSKFEKSIEKEISPLLKAIGEVLQSKSKMGMPENLEKIFENLDFYLDDIPISRRGDGHKVRHVPEILHFIGRGAISPSKGATPQTHIWGFEEPENCVELTAAFDFRDNFLKYAKKGFQMFFSTHSPIFYRMQGEGKVKVQNYFVQKETHYKKGRETTVKQIDHARDLDSPMGIMPVINEYTEKLHLELDDLRKEIKRLFKLTGKVIFLEGKTDENILKCALNLWYPRISNKLEIFNYQEHNIGTGGADTLQAGVEFWFKEVKASNPLAYVVFDNDEKGINGFNDFTEWMKNNPDSKKIIKAEKLSSDITSRISRRLQNNAFISTTLEDMYSNEFWQQAKTRMWLETRKLKLPTTGIDKNIFDQLTDIEKLRVNMQWKKSSKKTAVKHILRKFKAGGKSKKEIEEILNEFRPLCKKIATHFS